MIMSDDAKLSRQMRGSRTASGAGRAADSRRSPSRSHRAAATDAASIAPASAYRARAEHAGHHHGSEEGEVAVGRGGRRKRERPGAEIAGDHPALARAIGQRTPRKQRQRPAERECGEDARDPHEREVKRLLYRGAKRRQTSCTADSAAVVPAPTASTTQR
jgi:hypothetical protein